MGQTEKELETVFPPWGELTLAQRSLLSGSAREQEFGEGRIVHSGSEDCVGLLIILEGRLRAYTVSEEGRELTLYRLFERDICLFSASCIMSSIQFDITVAAEQDTKVLHIPPEIYKRLMAESLAVSNYTNELMASRFSDVMWLLDQVLGKKLDSRLAAFLLEESALSGSDDLSLTHEAISRHLGSVREVVTRMLRYFGEEGLVRLSRGRITLSDREGLAAVAAASLR